MKYTFVIHRDSWISVEFEAKDLSEAKDFFEETEFDGSLNDRFRTEVLETETEVAEAWQDDLCIYNIY